MRRTTVSLLAAFVAFGGAALAEPAFASEMKTFTPAALAAAQAAGKPIVVHVTASWCTTCQAQAPIVQGLLKEPKFKDLVVLTIDFDKDKADMRKLGVQDRSTFVAFKGKMQVARSSGDTEQKRIAHLFEQTL